MSNQVSFDEVVDTAVGLGGWKFDPADPFKAPYSPASAALAALRLHDWPEDDPDYAQLRSVLERVVQEEHDNDPTTREEITMLREAWTIGRALGQAGF